MDAQFDECYFPFRLVDQREHGHIAPQPKLDQLSLFHDLPNPTIEQLIERINSTPVPGSENDMRWLLSDLTKTPNTLSSGEGHKFHAALISSTPQYKYKVGEPQQYDAMLSAWHVRNAIDINHGGTHKTLNQIFGDQNTTR